MFGDVLFDLRTGLGIDHDDDVFEPRRVRIGGDEVDDALAVNTNGGELLHPAITSCTARGKDDQ